MVGLTLLEIRERVEALASDDGDFYVVCGRTGERPIPVSGLRFADRTTAERAASATEHYRAALRRYDPHVPCYDPIACEDTGLVGRHAGDADAGDGERRGNRDSAWEFADPVVADANPARARRDRVEFCHRVAAAVFETLSARDADAVETAIVDAYLALAERLSDPDDLCLCLLESMAAELDAHLPPSDQAAVLARAADRLPRPAATDEPVTASLARLERVGLLSDFSCSPGSIQRPGGPRTAVARVSAYSLAPTEDGLPVLPVVLDLFRHRPDDPPSGVRAAPTDDGWHLVFVFGSDVRPGRLATAPIRADP